MRGAAGDFWVTGYGWNEMDIGGEGKMKIPGVREVEADSPGCILVETGSTWAQNVLVTWECKST